MTERELRFIEAKIEEEFARLQKVFDLSRKVDEISPHLFLAKASRVQAARDVFQELVDSEQKRLLADNPKHKLNFSRLQSYDDLLDVVVANAKCVQMRLETEKGGKAAGIEAKVRLPRQTLPVFDGTFENWPNFYQSFTRLVHENPELSNLEKVNFLYTHLEGSAKAICAGLPPVEENYLNIYTTLVKRFSDQRMVGNHFFEKLVSFKAISQGNERDLNNFLNNFIEPARSLKALNIDNFFDFVMLYFAVKKLDRTTGRAFENAVREREMPGFEELETFIRSEAKIVARQPDLSASANKTIVAGPSNPKKTHAFVAQEAANGLLGVNTTKPRRNLCVACKSGRPGHPLYRCEAFRRMSPMERFGLVRKSKLCYCCLQSHFTAVCPSENVCEQCLKRHHTLLHLPERAPDPLARVAVSGRAEAEDVPASMSRSAALVSSTSIATTVLLSTAQVAARDSQGQEQIIRVLLDSGSQGEFISKDCCRRLGLKLTPIPSVVDGLGNKSTCSQARAYLTFSSLKQPEVKYSIGAAVLDEITTELPSTMVSLEGLPHLVGLDLADSTFNVPGPIDLLVGASLWAKIIGFRRRTGPPGCPTAIESSLGWIVIGETPVSHPKVNSKTAFLATGTDMETLLQKFWQIEELPTSAPATPEEDACEKFFLETVRRSPEGRYVVALPFKQPAELLGDTQHSSTQKFVSQEKRLVRSPGLREQYCQVMRSHWVEGYVGPVSEHELQESSTAYYVPHHAVMKPGSTSTPLRIVWNMSAPSSTGRSLNELLHVGPKLHADIFKILLNFRLFQVALSSDVRQMYLRILVRPEDRKYQRFVWRWDPEEEITLMQCNTVVFGMSCSPYLAQRVLRHLAEDCRSGYPRAAEVIHRDIFMDDFVSSAASEEEAVAIRDELVHVFGTASFTLAKWCSNRPSVLSGIPAELCCEGTRVFDADSPASTKILGLCWVAQDDYFSFRLNGAEGPCTKRNILSSVAKIFDPLGLVSPVIIVAKMLIKKLWNLKLDWDEAPPKHIEDKWKSFAATLSCLASLAIPRHLGVAPGSPAHLVGFADASMEAYGAVVYVRSGPIGGPAEAVGLLCSKSRVAPMKVLSIPRLELCAGVLLAKLLLTVIETYADRFVFESVHACTDSTVTLQWISGHPSRWKTFVCNRVAQIQECIPVEAWKHVPGDTNPADCLSRGLAPSEIVDFSLWMEGPSWLQQPECEWPLRPASSFTPALPLEECRVVALKVSSPPEWPLDGLLSRVSSLRRLFRITAWILRVATSPRNHGKYLQASELLRAEFVWIVQVQKQYFAELLEDLANAPGASRKGSNPLVGRLDLFLDHGVIRVGGRLQNASIPYDQQHPILLPKEGRFVELLVEQVHRDNLHTGPHLLMSLLRSRFWIVSARNLVRRLYHQCNTCFRARPRVVCPKMAPLPSCRLQESKAFTHTGVDYAGPLDIVMLRRRGSRSQKAYICLFICMSTKAVHLELASDLSTPSFLAALSRFLCRRGPVAKMYSDQGTNFVGARTRLQEMYAFVNRSDHVRAYSDELSRRGIQWQFNPPAAPHFGGLWEANVKCVKSLLFKTIGTQLLTFEEMLTLLSQIEALLNSRPLCELSNDPAAPAALTPAHFLTFGSTLQVMPAEDIVDMPVNRLAHHERINWIVQHYWQRWSQEYLHELQQRRKWTTETPALEKGSVVILMRERTRPLQWPLAVVEEVFPGRDGIVRTARVRSGGSILVRPVVKLCPLPRQ